MRFKITPKIIKFNDIVRDDVEFNSALIGDFVIARSDGMPTYNFSVVVDDILMKITHIIRGDDHLSNTPRQILLYEALDAKPPIFAHLPMICGKDKTPLSKRHGVTSIAHYINKGVLPDALFNYLALLGWAPEGNREILSRDEIIKEFTLEKVAKNPAVFDEDKLAWIGSNHIKSLSIDELTHKSIPYLKMQDICRR